MSKIQIHRLSGAISSGLMIGVGLPVLFYTEWGSIATTIPVAMILAGTAGIILMQQRPAKKPFLLKVVFTTQLLVAVSVAVLVTYREFHLFIIIWTSSIAVFCCIALIAFPDTNHREV